MMADDREITLADFQVNMFDFCCFQNTIALRLLLLRMTLLLTQHHKETHKIIKYKSIK